jgi:hypothetical protein
MEYCGKHLGGETYHLGDALICNQECPYGHKKTVNSFEEEKENICRTKGKKYLDFMINE